MIYGDLQRGEYYMSNSYNYLIADKKVVGIFDVSPDKFLCVGSPEQLHALLNEG